MTDKVRKTQLYKIYEQSAKLTVFAGFEMPLWYEDVIPEHLAVRNSVGMFDISHMGRVMITGADAERFLNHVITNDVSKLTPNGAQYSVMCNERGGIRDDFVVYRLESRKFLMVYNANNREKDYDWLVQNSRNFTVQIEEISDSVAMLAVQGPKAEKTLQKICAEDLSKIERFKMRSFSPNECRSFYGSNGIHGRGWIRSLHMEHHDGKPRERNKAVEHHSGSRKSLRNKTLRFRSKRHVKAGSWTVSVWKRHR